MIRVGLTGGIAAGKSTVSARLAELGALVIDADAIAREVVEPGTPGLAAVVAAFGPGVLADDGSLDRGALARAVFSDPDARSTLESIVHPLVRRRAGEIEAAAGDRTIVVHDIPLLVETGQQSRFDVLLVVDADEQTQRLRLEQLRGMDPDEAAARIAAQATRPDRLAVADRVIVNDGDLDRLRAQVDVVWADLVAISPAAPRGERT